MDIFQGNKKLEEVIFTSLDYALFARHNTSEAFIPFLMLYKSNQSKLVHVIDTEDPEVSFNQMLQSYDESFDQIVMCHESQVPFEGKEREAIIVTGFDTSEKHGLKFFQKFEGIESGKPFRKLGNPGLVSRNEKLPVRLQNPERKVSIKEPYLHCITTEELSGEVSREVFTGHHNSSILAHYLHRFVLDTLKKQEDYFTGKFRFNFVPGTIKVDEFNKFIFDQLVRDLKSNEAVQNWELILHRELIIELDYNEAKVRELSRPKPKVKVVTGPNYAMYNNPELEQEFNRISSHPNPESHAEKMTKLMAEFEKRGIDIPEEVGPIIAKKPWWKFW